MKDKNDFILFYKIKQLKNATFLIQYNEDKICIHIKIVPYQLDTFKLTYHINKKEN